ncbi:hypothetical protein GCM10009564_34250 [Streptomyces thermogriseus]|uniref:Uncharacterized protein n=1 Tax=Streptomyces thermogriseus TaxID=75292 RepID=A0ABP4DIV7_9ACTN
MGGPFGRGTTGAAAVEADDDGTDRDGRHGGGLLAVDDSTVVVGASPQEGPKSLEGKPIDRPVPLTRGLPEFQGPSRGLSAARGSPEFPGSREPLRETALA